MAQGKFAVGQGNNKENTGNLKMQFEWVPVEEYDASRVYIKLYDVSHTQLPVDDVSHSEIDVYDALRAQKSWLNPIHPQPLGSCGPLQE